MDYNDQGIFPKFTQQFSNKETRENGILSTIPIYCMKATSNKKLNFFPHAFLSFPLVVHFVCPFCMNGRESERYPSKVCKYILEWFDNDNMWANKRGKMTLSVLTWKGKQGLITIGGIYYEIFSSPGVILYCAGLFIGNRLWLQIRFDKGKPTAKGKK